MSAALESLQRSSHVAPASIAATYAGGCAVIIRGRSFDKMPLHLPASEKAWGFNQNCGRKQGPSEDLLLHAQYCFQASTHA
jgi:hypothetical protein